ncbi:HD family phosphohydrolase [Dethiothermospora halolimnae]|uniref:HD family phosphohydrolase n=1 Tax=Dethiothermospora halolimnae TaxID=3114390 RepID=UPI003CCC3E0B
MSSSKKKKVDKVKNNFIISFFKKTIVKQIILAVLFTSILFFILINDITPEKILVELGELAPRDIVATKQIIDDEETERLKQEAMNSIEPRHKVDLSIQVKMKNQVNSFFKLLEGLNNNEDKKLKEKLRILSSDSSIKLSENQYIDFLKLDKETLSMLQSNINDIIYQIMSTGIKAEELEYEKEKVEKIFSKLDSLDKKEMELGSTIVNTLLRPNRFLDVLNTQQLKQQAAERINPIVIEKGQTIVRKGEKIDQRAIRLIKKTGLYKENEGIEYKVIIGTLLIVIMLECLIIAYLYFFEKQVLNGKKLFILAIIILSVVAISKGIYGISVYLVPLSAATMLISIIIDPKLAILVNFILAIIIGFITGNDINIIIMMLVGGTVGALGVIKTQQRYNIFITGLIVSLTHVITIVSFGLIRDFDFQYILSKSLYGILNGIFSSILAVGSLPLWESLFGIVTPLKLLELSNPNHPLLKKLLLETPGTYHHSIVVGNLSEAAADAVEANSLVARIGSYYHDIGKLKRPYFFKENQLNKENPHDKINPSLSTLIITNHVKDGVEYAKQYKLPLVIRDIIQQHHGETLVAYFYHKALNGENSELVQEESFRYEGPKPQTKEAAIIMLADSVEAATRSMQDPTKGKIEGLVRKIIKGKLDDGQLDECGLTLKELNIIANSFLNVLFGIFHERIEYPTLDLKELKGAK